MSVPRARSFPPESHPPPHPAAAKALSIRWIFPRFSESKSVFRTKDDSHKSSGWSGGKPPSPPQWPPEKPVRPLWPFPQYEPDPPYRFSVREWRRRRSLLPPYPETCRPPSARTQSLLPYAVPWGRHRFLFLLPLLQSQSPPARPCCCGPSLRESPVLFPGG